LLLLLLSFGINYYLFISNRGVISRPLPSSATPTQPLGVNATKTAIISITPTPTTCPYLTRRDYQDNLQNIQMNVDVPQGCYMLVSIYSGYYIAPDNIN